MRHLRDQKWKGTKHLGSIYFPNKGEIFGFGLLKMTINSKGAGQTSQVLWSLTLKDKYDLPPSPRVW